MPRNTILTLGMAFLSSMLLAGCPEQGAMKTAGESDVKKEAENAEHAHEHTAPHGGHIIELGKHEYWAEVLFDASTKVVTIYVLGGHVDTPVAIPASDITFHVSHGDHEHELALKADPQTGDAEGKASKFVSEAGNEEVKDLADIEALHGDVHIKINGKDYEGALSHDHGKDGHDHDHDHEKKPEAAK